jgi:2-C-methyl-D-erythritol 2,4-cyclodiphosphate synthase
MVRTGIGFDAHKLVDGRKLILGGVEIKYHKGLLGHSDADVVCHAVADAILGAAGLGDIGLMFPDTDSANKDISSLKILSAVYSKIKDYKYRIVNIDITIVAEEPKIGPYAESMKKAMSQTLGIKSDDINIKGKTTETMGFTGRKEGIAALAVATIDKHEF